MGACGLALALILRLSWTCGRSSSFSLGNRSTNVVSSIIYRAGAVESMGMEGVMTCFDEEIFDVLWIGAQD